MIFVDPPRKYRKRGKSWAHVCSPDLDELEAYARKHGLKRKHRTPWIHYDVTAEELEFLPGLTHVTRRELSSVMNPYRQPDAQRTRRLHQRVHFGGIQTGD